MEAGRDAAWCVRRAPWQARALAVLEQLRDGRVVFLLQQQVAMRHRQVAGRHAVRHRALPGRAAIAVRRPGRLDAAVAQAQRHRRVGAAGQVAAMAGVERRRLQQGHGGARRGQRLGLGRLPAAGQARLPVTGGQLRPGACVEIIDAARLRPRQHVQHAGEGTHEAEKLAPRVLPAYPARQHLHQPVASQQHLHHRLRAAVGRAHLQQAAAGQGAEALPAVFQGQARHQSAHAVGNDAQGQSALLGVAHGVVEHGQEGAAGMPQREAPVIGEGPHFLALREIAGKRFIARFDPAGADDVRLAHGQAFDASFDQVHGVEPDAVAAHLQVAAHDVGQQQHDGRVRAPFRHFAAARQRAVLDAGQGLVGALVARERLHGGLAGRRALEVVQVVRVRPAQQQLPHRRAARGAAGHRGAIDHQVALSAVQLVVEAVAQPAQQAIAAARAGQHVQRAGHAHVGRVEQRHQGRVGHHRFQARQDARVAALLHHGQQEGHGAIGNAAVVQQVEHHAGPAVEAARHQGGAARRAGHAHEAGDADGARLQFQAQLAQARRIRVVAAASAQPRLRREVVDIVAVERFAAHGVFAQSLQAVAGQVDGAAAVDALRPRQQFAHQAAARMTEQVQHGAVRQLAHEGQRVLDGAVAEAAVLIAVDAVAVLRHQLRRQAIAPQAGKAALGRRRRAVQQQQHRFRPGGQAGDGRHAANLDAAAVQAQALFQLAILEGARRRQRRHGGGAAAVHAHGPQHPGAQAVAAGAGRLARPLRTQGQPHFDAGGRAVARQRGRPQIAWQVQAARQQRTAVAQ